MINQFLPDFLHNARRRIADLRRDLETLRHTSGDADNARRTINSIFQTLHTLKGSAAIFDFKTISATAHELETIVSRAAAGKTAPDADFINALRDGIERIAADLDDFKIGNANAAHEIAPESPNNQNAAASAVLAEKLLPAPLLAQLNERERVRLEQAILNDESLLLLEAAFAINEFARESEKLRAALLERGEIVATLPSANQTPGKIRLRFVVAANAANAISIANRFDAQTIFAQRQQTKPNFKDLCETAFAAGRSIAARRDQTIEFAISGDHIELSNEQADQVSIALLHIVRNALAHGIETPAERIAKGKSPIGKVAVETEQTADQIRISVADDGRGIDREKVRRKLAENSPDQTPENEPDALETIFAAGFSTAETLTEDAGRGVGLDAAASAIEKIGGRIIAESEPNRGARFTIVLPRV